MSKHRRQQQKIRLFEEDTIWFTGGIDPEEDCRSDKEA